MLDIIPLSHYLLSVLGLICGAMWVEAGQRRDRGAECTLVQCRVVAMVVIVVVIVVARVVNVQLVQGPLVPLVPLVQFQCY